MLFVTVGSTRFDDLISRIVSRDWLEEISELGFSRLILQVGQSVYDWNEFNRQKKALSHRMELELYDYKSSIAEDIERADLVVGHAGAGTCLEVLRAKKNLLIVVNDSLMDNHQDELAEELVNQDCAVRTTPDMLIHNLTLFRKNYFNLKEFPQRAPSNFEEIFDEALRRAISRS